MSAELIIRMYGAHQIIILVCIQQSLRFFQHMHGEIDRGPAGQMLVLHASPDEFEPWAGHDARVPPLWNPPERLEPYSRQQMLDYLGAIRERVKRRLTALDFDEADCRFPYYKGFSRLDHQLVNLRHLGGHVGQLSEILMAHGTDVDWIGKRAK